MLAVFIEKLPHCPKILNRKSIPPRKLGLKVARSELGILGQVAAVVCGEHFAGICSSRESLLPVQAGRFSFKGIFENGIYYFSTELYSKKSSRLPFSPC